MIKRGAITAIAGNGQVVERIASGQVGVNEIDGSIGLREVKFVAFGRRKLVQGIADREDYGKPIEQVAAAVHLAIAIVRVTQQARRRARNIAVVARDVAVILIVVNPKAKGVRWSRRIG